MAQVYDKDSDGAGSGRATILGLINLVRYLWGRKWWIAAATLAAGVTATGYSFLMTPVYRSEAVIALKEEQGGSNASGLLSQLGGLGGMMASQLGMGSSNLDRLEVLSRNREVLESVIQAEDLLPKFFPGQWDAKAGRWKDSTSMPSVRTAVERMRNVVLVINANPKQKNMKVSVIAEDSALAFRILSRYLVELNRKIVETAKSENKLNMEYLEKQLLISQDPLMREKLFQLIAMQVERSMMVSIRAFDVIEPPVVPLMKESPKRKRMALMSLFAGFVLSVVVITAVRWFRDVIGEAEGKRS